MQRVFALDVLECPRCHRRMRLLAAIHPPEATTAILECLSLPARAPPPDGARPDPEADVELGRVSGPKSRLRRLPAPQRHRSTAFHFSFESEMLAVDDEAPGAMR